MSGDALQPSVLPQQPSVPREVAAAVAGDYERFAEAGLPDRLEDYLAGRYRLDVSAEYAGYRLKNPWGKASGQLSMTARQVEEDVEAGLGFVVLKTVIAEDSSARRSMQAWAIKESRMAAERIVGRSGDVGWTISWKGRGWWESFEAYLELVRRSREIADGSGTLVVPSCKFHLPAPEEKEWNLDEYRWTVGRLLDAWCSSGGGPAVGWPGLDRREAPVFAVPGHALLCPDHPSRDSTNTPGSSYPTMPLEKDFSPTLAGSDRATAQTRVLEWLRTVPRLVREAARERVSSEEAGGCGVLIGLKLFNALFDDEFQLEMLRCIHAAEADRPDFFVYANRLFDPDREFDGHRGIAYGGPDLSERNLLVLSRFFAAARRGELAMPVLPFSATGNITSGRTALEYALRGATSFQMHTFFQLPADQYRMTSGGKTHKALHELYFHPQDGFIVWLHHLARRLMLPGEVVRFRDVVGKLGELEQIS